MLEDDLRKLLKKVWAQKLTPEEAVESLRHLPFEDIPYARIDNHRDLRCGFPEVIFCQGKRIEDITAITRSMSGRGARAASIAPRSPVRCSPMSRPRSRDSANNSSGVRRPVAARATSSP